MTRTGFVLPNKSKTTENSGPVPNTQLIFHNGTQNLHNLHKIAFLSAISLQLGLSVQII